MKTHFCIPVSQQRPDALGGRYTLYSVYLDGFLFCRVRYSQLHRWNEQAMNKKPFVIHGGGVLNVELHTPVPSVRHAVAFNENFMSVADF